MDYGEKKAHRGRIDLSPGKCFAFLLFLVSYSFFPTCNFFLEYDPRFSVAPFQDSPGGGNGCGIEGGWRTGGRGSKDRFSLSRRPSPHHVRAPSLLRAPRPQERFHFPNKTI